MSTVEVVTRGILDFAQAVFAVFFIVYLYIDYVIRRNFVGDDFRRLALSKIT